MNRNKNNSNSRRKFRKNGKSTSTKVKSSNYQDEAEIAEFEKGLRAGRKFPTQRAVHSNNDPQWYFKQSQVLQDVASFSFAHPLGSRINYTDILKLNNTDSIKMYYSAWLGTIPGLMSLTIAPTPGVAVDSQSPVNIAATNVYSYVRYKNSGAANYDSPDLMMYLLTMDSLYSCWNWMKRLYGMASVYSQMNKYMPRAWFEANNVDLEDMLMHLADFRAFLNVKANEIASFCVPATMTLHVRHSWLFSNVYKDSDTSKAQQYIFVPAYFYKYEEAASAKGGQLTPQPLLWRDPTDGLPAKLKVSDLMSYMNSLVQAANYSEDIGIMSGDILKAYGESNLFTLSLIDPDYRVDPVFSKEVLSQIENARSYPYSQQSFPISGFAIKQDPNTNFITFQPSVDNASSFGAELTGDILNFHWESPTPEDVIVATRFKATYNFTPGSQANKFNWIMTSCGSEVMLETRVFFFAADDNPANAAQVDVASYTITDFYVGTEIPVAQEGVTSSLPNTWTEARNLTYAANAVRIFAAFDWHPMVWITADLKSTAAEGQEAHFMCGDLCDYDIYTVLTNDNLEALNSLAILSELNVPN